MPTHIPSRQGPANIPLRKGGVGWGALLGVPIDNQEVDSGLQTRDIRRLSIVPQNRPTYLQAEETFDDAF